MSSSCNPTGAPALDRQPVIYSHPVTGRLDVPLGPIWVCAQAAEVLQFERYCIATQTDERIRKLVLKLGESRLCESVGETGWFWWRGRVRTTIGLHMLQTVRTSPPGARRLPRCLGVPGRSRIRAHTLATPRRGSSLQQRGCSATGLQEGTGRRRRLRRQRCWVDALRARDTSTYVPPGRSVSLVCRAVQ